LLQHVVGGYPARHPPTPRTRGESLRDADGDSAVKDSADVSFEKWTLKAPEADLFDANGRAIGRHYAGPTWELMDGSEVVGKFKARADAP
jgi:hypothetical protein